MRIVQILLLCLALSFINVDDADAQMFGKFLHGGLKVGKAASNILFSQMNGNDGMGENQDAGSSGKTGISKMIGGVKNVGKVILDSIGKKRRNRQNNRRDDLDADYQNKEDTDVEKGKENGPVKKKTPFRKAFGWLFRNTRKQRQ